MGVINAHSGEEEKKSSRRDQEEIKKSSRSRGRKGHSEEGFRGRCDAGCSKQNALHLPISRTSS